MAFERIVRRIAGGSAYAVLGVLVLSILRGARRKAGRATGLGGVWLRTPWIIFLSSLLFISASRLGWKPLRLKIPPSARAVSLAAGVLFYFPGLFLALWGRFALGKNYTVSSGLGAQLFADHQLVTTGLFRIVRHPMYLGVILASFGGLFIFQKWTTLVYALFAPLVFMLRAHREEEVLAAEFGEQWRAYCRRTPAFLPFPRPR